MILESEISLVTVTTAVLEQVEGIRPVLLAELGSLQQIDPLFAPKLVTENLHAILVVSNLAVLYNDFHLVPLTCRLCVLRLCYNHVVERCRLTDAEGCAQLSIGVTLVVKNLALRA